VAGAAHDLPVRHLTRRNNLDGCFIAGSEDFARNVMILRAWAQEMDKLAKFALPARNLPTSVLRTCDFALQQFLFWSAPWKDFRQ
jgi:hypothetical protein